MTRTRHAHDAYEPLAASYDRRWRRYHEETLSRAAGAVAGEPGSRILDAPCGTGELVRWLLPRLPDGRIVGVDGSAAMLRVAQAKWRGEGRVSFQQANVEALPFADGTFDAVLCCNSLHAFHHPERAVAEFVRVLKPGGRLLLLDWCRDPWHCRLVNWWKVRRDPTHVWMYTTEELRALLEAGRLIVHRLARFRVAGIGPLKLWEMMVGIGAPRSEGQP